MQGKAATEWDVRVARDDRDARNLLRRVLRADSNCVDIGANRGVFLKQFVRLAPKGQHTAFEPIPELAAVLIDEFPEIEVFNCALSNRAGKAAFYHVPDMDSWSGLRKQQYPADVDPVAISVELACLDDCVKSDVRIDFIKIDVEGAELEVLEGAQATIARWKPWILFEHARIHNENYETTPDMVYDFLVSTCGLQIWDLALQRSFSKDKFIDVYESSHASYYDRNAQTNFVARPGSI